MHSSSFPKKVGLIFVEKFPYEKTLDFEQAACAFFLLQMNKHQSTFEFQIINPHDHAPELNKDLETWFISEIKIFEKYRHYDNYIDYWIAIASLPFYEKVGWYFYKVDEKVYNLEKPTWFITSYNWKKNDATFTFRIYCY